ncbi:MAG: RNA 2',3'-cyclic phosphodiesterase [bacterium]|nr:RNA 2',3'-cyclic phosphodiesterase [bacterium]
MIRTFIAAPIPEEIRKKLKDIQTELRKHENGAVRWTNPEGIHLTFHFLGEIEESGVKDLGEMLKEAASACRSFSCRVRGLGAFPNLQRPRVFWAGLEIGNEAGKLHQALKAGLVRLRYPVESRAFSPHLTLGRVKSPSGLATVIRQVGERKETELGEFGAREIILFKSDLRPGGSVYTPLVTQELTRS